MQQAAKSRETGRYWQICDTAAHIFAKKGYERTSLDDVAAELNITKPGLYYYFRSKDELLYKIIQYHWDNLYQPIKKKLDECDDPVEIIRFAIAQHFGYVLKNPEEPSSWRRSILSGRITFAPTRSRRRNTRTRFALKLPS